MKVGYFKKFLKSDIIVANKIYSFWLYLENKVFLKLYVLSNAFSFVNGG